MMPTRSPAATTSAIASGTPFETDESYWGEIFQRLNEKDQRAVHCPSVCDMKTVI
jgi:hypothetical protein